MSNSLFHRGGNWHFMQRSQQVKGSPNPCLELSRLFCALQSFDSWRILWVRFLTGFQAILLKCRKSNGGLAGLSRNLPGQVPASEEPTISTINWGEEESLLWKRAINHLLYKGWECSICMLCYLCLRGGAPPWNGQGILSGAALSARVKVIIHSGACLVLFVQKHQGILFQIPKRI